MLQYTVLESSPGSVTVWKCSLDHVICQKFECLQIQDSASVVLKIFGHMASKITHIGERRGFE